MFSKIAAMAAALVVCVTLLASNASAYIMGSYSPGLTHVILVQPNGDMGYVTNIDYEDLEFHMMVDNEFWTDEPWVWIVDDGGIGSLHYLGGLGAADTIYITTDSSRTYSAGQYYEIFDYDMWNGSTHTDDQQELLYESCGADP